MAVMTTRASTTPRSTPPIPVPRPSRTSPTRPISTPPPHPAAPIRSREPLIAFTNGQTGAANPQRQGLNAAILDGPPPLNILQEIPEPKSRFDYSPMWDIHLENWTGAAVAAGLNLRQTDFSAALQQVTDGNATGFPAGSAFGPSGFIVNCPVVSLDVNVSG